MMISVVEVVFGVCAVVVWCSDVVASTECPCEVKGVVAKKSAILGFITTSTQGYVRVPLAMEGEHFSSKMRHFANTSAVYPEENGEGPMVLQDIYESRPIVTTTTTTAAAATATSATSSISLATSNDKSGNKIIRWSEIILPESTAFSKSLTIYLTEDHLNKESSRTFEKNTENSSDEAVLSPKGARYLSYMWSSSAFEYVLLTRPGEAKSSSFGLVIFGPGDDFGRRG
ncbi:uncharacterized protein LOC122262182 [Penaeus japonicus]|uniref:uncharacterized protein LOC122262182 n=1 Tax=Penaeus japonicus TaxID=27405 RepID=UPI001C7151D5|nr:uncharacterized protein LOC122262182 [Penaeus japonicus]